MEGRKKNDQKTKESEQQALLKCGLGIKITENSIITIVWKETLLEYEIKVNKI